MLIPVEKLSDKSQEPDVIVSYIRKLGYLKYYARLFFSNTDDNGFFLSLGNS